MRRRRLWMLASLLVPALTGIGAAAEPLHVRIDRLIEAKADGQSVGAVAGDSEFLRRVFLDLAGRIPTVEETRRFLKDDAADKRATLIEDLLNGPDYPRRMQELFHVMLMERRGEDEEWTKFLRASFEANKPWDEMARAILHPDAEDETARGGAYFYTARLVSEGAMAPVEIPRLTRDVGRLFLGLDLKCAQCHDHVSIDDYKQQDFQGLHAFFVNLTKRRGTEFPAVSQKPTTEKLEFMSVFVQVPETTGPRVPGGEEIAVPALEKDEIYLEKPDRKKKKAGKLRFSPLRELAARMPAPRNEHFARNMVNRMWFVMMGRGLVRPLDEFHKGNPPSHPELLDRLAEEFVARDYDLKWLFREMALSKTYQRTSIVPDGTAPPEQRFLFANEKRLTAEQLLWSMLVATGERQRIAEDEAKLGQLREKFVDAFAAPPRQAAVDFNPTVKAALFVLNEDRVLNLLEPRPDNLVDRLAALSHAGKIADELYLSVLSRKPTDEERAGVAGYLEKHSGNAEARATALGHLAWALLSSTEFCVNH